MAVFRFSKYKICYLLMSQPNLCSGAVAIQHKMLSRLLTYRKEKMSLISLLLTETCKKKNLLSESHVNIGCVLNPQIAGGYYINVTPSR